MLTRLGPPLTILLLAGPILAGLLGTALPAFGWLPALGGTEFTTRHFADVLQAPGLLRSAATSLVAGFASALIATATMLLFIAAWEGGRAFRRIRALISPLLSVPHAAAAFGLAFLIAPSGMIARLVSPELTGWHRPPDLLIVNDPMGISLVIGLAVKEIPFLLLVSLAALPQIEVARLRAISTSLGYGRISGFVYCIWPALYRQIRLAVFAVIAFATSVVDVAMILGPTTPPTLAVRLVEWMNDPDLSMRFVASAGAMLQLGVTATALLAWIVLERVGRLLRDGAAAAGRRLRRDAVLRLVSLALMVLPVVAIGGGLAALGLWSVAGLWQFPDLLPSTLTARAWMQAAPRLVDPLLTTLAAGVISTAIAICLVMLCLRREDHTGRRPGRASMLLIYLPLLVPQAAFLFGLQVLAILSGAGAGLASLVLVHLVFVLPYVFLSLSDPWRAFDRRYELTAAGLGVSRLRTFWSIRAPMLLTAILAAAAVGFAVSVGQYLPTVLIGAGRLSTVTTEAVALASGGNRRVIGIWAFVQMLLPLGGFLIATLVPALLFRRFRAMRA